MKKSIHKYAPVFILPTLLAFALFFIIPFLMGISLSFTKFTTVTNAKWVGLQNYIKAFTFDKEFVHALIFTSLFTIVSIITVNIFAFSLALALTRGLKGTTIFRSIFFLPNLIGGIVLGYIWNLLINGILSPFGVDISYKTEYGFWGLVVLTNWQLIGYNMVIYIAGLQNFPAELLEAAEIDGANDRQIFFRITLPNLRTILTYTLVTSLIGGLSMYDIPKMLNNGTPNNNNNASNTNGVVFGFNKCVVTSAKVCRVYAAVNKGEN